ncbi:hypothetical protein LK13_05445 [Paenibacillus polymyxa]|nr:hypothetical protein PPSQR21_036490 [Paenibacillus polymyxa SQR-21]AIY08072.1 hypothetical protein LK13_05445 [Paenibacillus polymyxa]
MYLVVIHKFGIKMVIQALFYPIFLIYNLTKSIRVRCYSTLRFKSALVLLLTTDTASLFLDVTFLLAFHNYIIKEELYV